MSRDRIDIDTLCGLAGAVAWSLCESPYGGATALFIPEVVAAWLVHRVDGAAPAAALLDPDVCAVRDALRRIGLRALERATLGGPDGQ